MKFEKIVSGEVTLTFSADELLTINNALNEVCNAMDANEFQTRIGMSLPEALKLLRQLTQITPT